MAENKKYTLDQKRECIKRELGYRKSVYPRLVTQGKIKRITK
jgi:hypothetical protein